MTLEFPYRKILVPIDFSTASEKALAHAVSLAGKTGAELVLLTVVDTSFPYPDLYSFEDPNHDYFQVMRDRALERMRQSLAGVSGSLKVTRLVGRGRPKVEIPAMAEEVGADLIVIARGGRGLRSALLGSTTDAVLHDASCPVLVLPLVGGDVSPLEGA